MSEMSIRRDLKVGAVAALIVGLVVAGAIVFTSGGTESAGSAPPLSKAELASVRKRVAANEAEANQVVDGSIEAKVAALRGVPVVVNQWASWCPGCRAEFPFFQRLAKRFRGKVAFVGLDSQDNRGDAEGFLERYPVTYPSVFDPDASEAESIGAGQGWPTTIFYDRQGRRTHIRPGGYATAAQLRADIETYALGEGA
jgi:cytochrome c biogenesis protein CcmG/thiol:disulfide interchange protein DsbE